MLHGGPDFDHGYLLPDLDRLADSFRLIYYDQRGRGRSADQVLPEEVTMASEMDDLDMVRQHFDLASPALLGHSWGAVLALEYALRHPERVSHMILMNPAPASTSDLAMFRTHWLNTSRLFIPNPAQFPERRCGGEATGKRWRGTHSRTCWPLKAQNRNGSVASTLFSWDGG